MHEYYMSILKIRLGTEIYNSIYEKVYESDYFLNVAIKFKSNSKFPNFLQILTLTRADLRLKNRFNMNSDLMEALFILHFFHEKINKDFSLCDEENLTLLQNDLFYYYENNIYNAS